MIDIGVREIVLIYMNILIFRYKIGIIIVILVLLIERLINKLNYY